MVKLTYLREEDYWLVPLSFISVFLIGACFYVGVTQMRLLTALPGFLILYFTTYIIRRGYNQTRAQVHVAVVILLAAAGAYGFHLLTN